MESNCQIIGAMEGRLMTKPVIIFSVYTLHAFLAQDAFLCDILHDGLRGISWPHDPGML